MLLARALYKRPKILLLDEATSHLDLAREKQVSEAIRHLQITRVIVAHRPETIATADRVISLEGGTTADSFDSASAARPSSATGGRRARGPEHPRLASVRSSEPA